MWNKKEQSLSMFMHCSKGLHFKYYNWVERHTELKFTCSKSTIEILEKGGKYVQS